MTQESKTLILPRCEFGFWSVRAWDGGDHAATALLRDSKKAICQGYLLGRHDAEREAVLSGMLVHRKHWLLLCKPSGEVVWTQSLRPRHVTERQPMLSARLEGDSVVVALSLQSGDGRAIFKGRASAQLSIPDALRAAAIEALRAHENQPQTETAP